MSTGATTSDAAKLAKTLRIEDVLISASALPLPLDLSPSRLPQPNLDTADASQDAKDTHANPSTADGAPPVHASVADAAPPDAAPAQDAVVKSLQAAHDAIHASLQDAGGNPGAPAAGAQLPDDGQAPDLANISSAPASPAGDISALTQIVPGPTHALPQLDLPADVATLFPASTADHALANVVHDVQSAVGELGSVIDGVLGPVAGAPIDLGATVASAVADVAAPVEHVVQSAVSLVMPADSETHAGPAAAAPANTPSPPPPPPQPSAPEAVTVPSLHGVGVDALAGLLQPAATAADATHDVAPSHPGFDDLSLLPPIGLDDVAHPDQAASHATHALPPAGSGLI